jgi:alcohol dehydrogenase (cytochrome c)
MQVSKLVLTRTALTAAIIAAIGGVALAAEQPPGPPGAPPLAQGTVSISPVTDAMLRNPAPGEWLQWRQNQAGWDYSPLNQINTRNVKQLQMVWSRAMGAGIQEAMPLVHDGVMFLPNPSDLTQAIDAASGDLKWEFRRPIPADANKYFPVPSINRNVAIYGKLIIDMGMDNYAYAINAETGKLAWETKIHDYQKGAQQTSGPIIANGKAIAGRGCEPEGGPDACVITAHDAVTGKELWRTRTIPRPGEPGSETWADVPDEARWHTGTWLVPSYDPELNLVYIGTSVTSPAPKFMLGGNDHEYLYHNSTLAINPDTGKIVWHYQHVVDHWDLDHPFERILVDTAVTPDKSEVTWINPRLKPGEKRKVLTGIPGKTGLVYTLDRATGEFLWARPTVYQTVISSIDGATGKVTVNPAALMHKQGDTVTVCPNANGGKNWQAGTYSPLGNVMFFPLQNTCMQETAIASKPSLDTLYAFASKASIAPGTDKVGTVQAISVETGKTLWKYEQRAGTMSLVSTAGGLVFGGDTAGRFRALDQKTGKVLWEVNLGSSVTGYPISYSVKGRQYVAVSTGISLAGGGTAQLTPEIRPSAGNNIFVFALPER